MTLPNGTPLVVFGDDWGRHTSTIQHVVQRIIPRFPVIWLNSIGHRNPRLTVYDLRRAAAKAMAMVRSPVTAVEGPAPDLVAQPVALPWHSLAPIRAFNSASIARSIRKAIREIAPGRAPIFVSGSPAAVDIVGRIGELASIYYCLDEYAASPGVSSALIEPLELEMLEKVHAVIVTARALLESKQPASGRIFYLPQGVNYDHFATPQPVPDELARLPRPLIGLIGNVDDRCDFPLIRAVAESNPDGSVVIIGPIVASTAELDMENIHLLGKRTYAELPAFVQAFDVGLIPYVYNRATMAIDPLKLLEYLAAGIPVVSTALPEAEKYSSVVSIARDREPFVRAVSAALTSRDGDARSARRDVARQNMWESRAERFVEIIHDVVASRNPLSPQWRPA